jgi:hypothetical protein
VPLELGPCAWPKETVLDQLRNRLHRVVDELELGDVGVVMPQVSRCVLRWLDPWIFSFGDPLDKFDNFGVSGLFVVELLALALDVVFFLRLPRY